MTYPFLPVVLIAALKQHDHVYRILALKCLEIRSDHDNPPFLPDSFLGGSAPHLEDLVLFNIPFPGLSKLLLLLSTRDLDFLELERIPRSGYLSPETILTCLSTLTRLQEFHLMFRFPRSQVERASRRPPPLTRVIHPTLTYLRFRGDSAYLEDLVSESRIDTPSLNRAHIRFFNQLVFDTPLPCDFIDSSVAQKKNIHGTPSSRHPFPVSMSR